MQAQLPPKFLGKGVIVGKITLASCFLIKFYGFLIIADLPFSKNHLVESSHPLAFFSFFKILFGSCQG